MDLCREIRRAARQLLAAPSFTVPAVLLLALGLGSATAMFSVARAILIRPIVPEQEWVVVLFPRDPSKDDPFQEISPPDFRDWKDAATSFDELAAFGAGFGRFSWCSTTAVFWISAESPSHPRSSTPSVERRSSEGLSRPTTRSRRRKGPSSSATPCGGKPGVRIRAHRESRPSDGRGHHSLRAGAPTVRREPDHQLGGGVGKLLRHHGHSALEGTHVQRTRLRGRAARVHPISVLKHE